MTNKNYGFPLVSIVIPVYNGANYLGKAIDSALNQTYSNCEIIVVNDGSTDNGATEQVALSYGNKIRYFSKENGKVSTALNLGIREMRGEYFAWLSHDDIFYPDKIQKQLKTLQKTSTRIVAASCCYFTDNGRKIPFRITDGYGMQLLEKSVFSVIHGMIQFGGVLLHKDIFDMYGTFREDLFTIQDYEFLFRVLRKEKCAFMEDIVNGIRSHSAQTSHTSSDMEKERDILYEMYLKELTQEEQINIYGTSYNFLYQILIRLIALPVTVKSLTFCETALQHYEKIGVNFKSSDKIYIYGAGRNGRRLLFDLRCRNINVLGFLDKSDTLKGRQIDGVICHNLEEIHNFAPGYKILIAAEYKEEMAKTLQGMGVNHYQYEEDYEREHQFLQTSPPIESVMQWIKQYKENGWKKV